MRRTVSIDPTLAESVDRAVADGAARSVSAFFEDAARCYLDRLARERLAVQADRLDAEEERSLAQTAASGGDPPAPRSPWPSLGGGPG